MSKVSVTVETLASAVRKATDTDRMTKDEAADVYMELMDNLLEDYRAIVDDIRAEEAN